MISFFARSSVLFFACSSLVGCPADTESTPITSAPTPDAGAPDAETGAQVDAEVDAKADAKADAPSSPPTHTGLVSIQDIAIANLPAAGHGLTVTALFQGARRPAYEEQPGEVTGCRAWSYDVATAPPPAEEDHGALRVEGVENGAFGCAFQAGRGYVCPTASGTGSISVALASSGTASYEVEGASFAAADVGRYLRVGSATSNANQGAFAIVSVVTATKVVVANPRAAAETFAAPYTVLAGAGPTPADAFEPFPDGAKVTIDLAAGNAFDAIHKLLTPGSAFTLDEGSSTRIQTVPMTGEAMTLACASCGTADGTIVRLTTTDADVTGLSPVAMPAARKTVVEIQCVALGTGSITVPAAAMELVRKAHAASPITRIRTAYMRDGLAVTTNAPPKAPNRVALATGHGVLGFTKP